MHKRASWTVANPGAHRAMAALERHVRASGIEPRLLYLVQLLASYRNGCARCVDMHAKDARVAGEVDARLAAIPVWRQTPYFTPRERAALAWTEALTAISGDSVDDATYGTARAHFEEAELVDLALAVVAINGWNRLSIAFRSEVGAYRPERARKESA